jgi:hypothetical protein
MYKSSSILLHILICMYMQDDGDGGQADGASNAFANFTPGSTVGRTATLRRSVNR